MNEQVLWIWLSLACTPGTENFSKLISEFETVDAIYALDESELKRVIGSKSCDFSALLDKDTKKAEEIFKYCAEKNIGILKYSDKEYYSFNTGLELPEGGEEIFDEILQTINKYKQGDD